MLTETAVFSVSFFFLTAPTCMDCAHDPDHAFFRVCHLSFCPGCHDILLDLSVIPDFRNNTRYIIDLDQTSLGLPDHTYLIRGLNDTAVEAYLCLIVEAAHLLGAPDKEAAPMELMDALHFEITLAHFDTA
ncbi:hypothetical protein HPB48_027098 [Haemaphysalis longicornis]|uniref:Peptidase M13 N-terminal domain-containing protein n=1 Tax=Haemaphysalis longicornis TaxID=44386 RepID=A0A9J6HBE2_HAELO|nr:hypothetical protein HPB48_027098 [Haemaphysalis longicornis]